ncbi:MAG TPA: hypothetical protein VFZ80_03710 [Acidimicrobiia bacterium]
MMHPIDTTTIREHEADYPSSSEIRTGWWAIVALMILVALLVTVVLVFSGDESSSDPEAPQPTEAPLDSGA